MPINNDTEMLNHVLKMVSMTEKDYDVAVGVAATIGSLMLRGYKDLALDVLATYEPKEAS